MLCPTVISYGKLFEGRAVFIAGVFIASCVVDKMPSSEERQTDLLNPCFEVDDD